VAAVSLAALSTPVSEAEPCGPDLEFAADPDYMLFMVRAEGLLPTSYFAFERSSIDFAAERAALETLLGRTRDLRLLVLLGKLLCLDRDLPGFAACLEAIATLLVEHWDDVHPRGDEGDFGLRMAALSTLDDLPHVIFPLQSMPLVNHRRLGAISLRTHLLATGEIQPRADEQVPDRGAVEKGLAEAGLPELLACRDALASLRASLTRIRTVSTERAGYEQAVSLEKLPPLVDRMTALVGGAVAKLDPSLAPTTDPPAGANGADGPPAQPGIQSSPVTSILEAGNALAAAARYFAEVEPSSPALLLIRQAEQLMGKSFLEALQILVPEHYSEAVISLGSDQTFDLPVERLSAFAPSESDAEVPKRQWSTALSSRVEAKSRREAIGLLEQVGIFYRAVEPSSAIPMLTDRARSLAERDFLSLLKQVLPESALKSSALS